VSFRVASSLPTFKQWATGDAISALIARGGKPIPPITASNVTALAITRRRDDLRALFIAVLSTGEQIGLKQN